MDCRPTGEKNNGQRQPLLFLEHPAQDDGNTRALGIETLNADCTMVGGIAVAATRGWITPSDPRFDPAKDQVVYQREIQRLERALSRVPDDAEQVIAMMHFPLTPIRERRPILSLLVDNAVDIVVYGHLHGRYLQNVLTGIHWNMKFYCVSADYLDFTPCRIL